MEDLKRFIKTLICLFEVTWKSEKMFFVLLAIYFLSVSLTSYFIIMTPRLIIEYVSNNTMNFNNVVIFFILLFIVSMTNVLCKYFLNPIGLRIRYKLLNQIMIKDLSISIDKFEDPNFLNKIWILYQPVCSVEGVQSFFSSVYEIVGNFGSLMIIIFILSKLNWWISFLVIAFLVFYLYLVFINTNKQNKILNELGGSYREIEYLKDLSLDPSNIKEIKIFLLKKWYTKKCKKAIKKLEKIISNVNSILMKTNMFDSFVQCIRDIIIYCYLIYLYYHKIITLGEFSSYGVLLFQLNNISVLISENMKKVLLNYKQINDMFEYIKVENEKLENGKTLNETLEWEISFKNVSFHYPNSNHYVFNNLNLSIKKGKKVGVIGLNGSGKTTLIKLLMRLYVPTKGVIEINNVNINEYKLKDYYSLFAPVFQEINIFPYTITENLLFDKTHDKNIIKNALTQVGLNKKIDECSLDKRMTKLFDKDGLQLSGGEQQKFVMARAICSLREILILDEPTSAFDPLAEYDFYKKIRDEYKDKTIIFISHRLASTQFCDELVLINDKNAIEKGTHEELMKKRGVYFDMFNIQAKYYKEINDER